MRAGQVAADWRSLQDEPCSCSPGDGTERCPRESECLDAYYRFTNGERHIAPDTSRDTEAPTSQPIGPDVAEGRP